MTRPEVSRLLRELADTLDAKDSTMDRLLEQRNELSSLRAQNRGLKEKLAMTIAEGKRAQAQLYEITHR